MAKNDRFLEVMACDRCNADLEKTPKTLSYMNCDVICVDCQISEREHPLFEIAKQKEFEEVRKRNYNYPGLFAGQKYPDFKL